MHIKKVLNYLIFSSVILSACFGVASPLQAYEGSVDSIGYSEADSHDHAQEYDTNHQKTRCHDQLGADYALLTIQTDSGLYTKFVCSENAQSVNDKNFEKEIPLIVVRPPPDQILKEIKTIRLLS